MWSSEAAERDSARIQYSNEILAGLSVLELENEKSEQNEANDSLGTKVSAFFRFEQVVHFTRISAVGGQ